MRMKHSGFSAMAVMVIAGFALSACGGLGKMAKYAETIQYDVQPNPLIVRGDSVELNINGKFPGKYFSKKAMVELTPVLTYPAGQTPYKTVGFQGESAAGNYTVIPYENGKNFTYHDKVAYSPEMKDSDLMLNILGRQGNKERQFDPYKLADGVITTPYLMMSDDMPIIAADNFERVTSHFQYGVINYLVNSSVVRQSELNDQDIRDMRSFLRDHAKNSDYVFQNAEIVSYASPEGELSFNENLAEDRANSAKNAVSQLMRNARVQFDANAFFNLKPKGEDWDGFKKKMQESNIEDKELILRILEMYPDKTKREAEIRNLAATYTIIAETILPELRRSQITLNYDIEGRSDEEIIALARGEHADSLNVEEMLYAATLTDDENERFAIYEYASNTYADDYRATNNMGVIYLQRNELSKAKDMFERSISIQDNQEAKNNLAIIHRLNGDREEAMSLLEAAAGAGDEVNYNMGIIKIQNGDYEGAINDMKGKNTFNKALAQVLSGNNEAALATINASDDADTAMGYYLKAIIGARMNDAGMVSTNLNKAYELDASLKSTAAEDLEFRNFQNEI